MFLFFVFEYPWRVLPNVDDLAAYIRIVALWKSWAQFQFSSAPVPDDVLAMLLYVACGFSGKAAALQQDRQRICRSEFHVLIPVVPIECFVAHDIPVLMGEQ